MYRVQGHTIEEQHDLAEQFSEVVTHSLDQVTDQFIAHFMPSAVVAAADPSVEGQAYLESLWQAQVEGVFSTFIGATYDSAGLGLAHDVLGHADLPDGVGVPGLSDDNTASYVRATANKMKGVSDELWSEISTSLAEGVNNGESIEQLAERVKNAAMVTTPRALTVARTTVVNASNAGSFAQATLLATDDAMKKQWVATEDLRTRDDHREADGQTVPLMGKFTVGGWLMDHPGDPDAPAGEVINCRCTLVYDLNEDGPIFTCTLSSAVFTASMATMPGAGTGACVTPTATTPGGASSLTLPPGVAQSLFVKFQGHQKISPAYGGAKIHKQLAEAKLAYAHVPGITDASDDELLHIIDQQYKLAGGKTSFHEKYTEWVTTGPGKKFTPKGTVSVTPPGAHVPVHAPMPGVPSPSATTGGPIDLLDISSVTPKMQADLWQAFKGVKPVTPNWGGAAIFKNLQAAKASLGPEFAGLNDGQLLKILDKEWAAKGVGKTFFDETTTWLKTPGAKTYIDKAGLSHASIPDPGLTPATPPLSAPVSTTAVPPTGGVAPSWDVGTFASTVGKDVTSNALAEYESAYAMGYPLPEALDMAKDVDPKLGVLTDDQLIDLLDHEYASSGIHAPGDFKDLVNPGGHVPVPSPFKKAAKKTAKITKVAKPPKPPSGYGILGTGPDGDISGIPEDVQQKIYQHFKSSGVYLTSTGPKIWDTVKSMQMLKDYETYTPLQLIRILDEQGAKKFGVVNANPFEEKMVKWLKTPSGKSYATGIAPKVATPGVPLPKGSFTLDEIDRPITATAETYSDITTYDAQSMQSYTTPWTPAQRSALRYYTGNNYSEMNGILRGTRPGSASVIAKIRQAQAGMRPSTRPLMVHRGTGLSQLGLSPYATLDDVRKLIGETMEDKGFMSTSVGSRAAFSGKVRLDIEAPTGTPMAFVKSVSHFSGEDEMLLAAGTRFKILDVTDVGGIYHVRVRVVR